MTPLTAGRVARRLLAFYRNDPKRWRQNWFWNEKRTCFCVLGALREILDIRDGCDDNTRFIRYGEASTILAQALDVRYINHWNDSCVSFYEFKTDLKRIARLP